MEKPTLEDYQNMPSSLVYLTMVVEKAPKGIIPTASICAVVKFNHIFGVDQEKKIDSRRFYLASTRPVLDFYPEGQYKFCMKDGHVVIEFEDSEPYNRYIDYAGKNFDKYLVSFVRH